MGDRPMDAAPVGHGFELTPPVRVLLSALSAAAGVIHLAMVPSHWTESAVEGAGFAITGWFQIAIAIWLLVRPTALVVRAAVVASLAFVVVWIARGLGAWGGLPDPIAPERGVLTAPFFGRAAGQASP